MATKMSPPPLLNLTNAPPQADPETEQLSTSLAKSTPDQDSGEEAEVLESVIRGVRSSKRLFFSPEKSNSILENATDHKRSTSPNVVSIESRDPYMDFRTSMEEMVEADGLCHWELLEELLGCYLMVNEKKNHGYIIRAFVDLVLCLSFVKISSSSGSCCSPVVSDSFITSSSSPQHFSSSSVTTGEASFSRASLAHTDV